MTPGKFLRLVWPSTGIYCIAHPFTPAGSSVTTYYHKIFKTISEAVTHVHEMQHTDDTFFAVLSLEKEEVWDPSKKDYKTGKLGAKAVRTQSNMLAAKSAFFDIDVGPESSKYPTQSDALLALREFLTKTALPEPTLISSGGGVHAYWHYAEDVPVAEWRPIAWMMRQLAEGLGFKIDPMRTLDTSSVLRVVDTYNWKDRANPRPVVALQEGAVTPVATFKQIVSDALVRNAITVTEAPAPRTVAPAIEHDLGPQTFNDYGPPPTLEEVGGACAQVREIVRSQTDKSHPHFGALDNPAWYKGMLGVVKHVEDGDAWCHKLTDLHPRDNADLNTKLRQLEQFPPARCETLQQFMPWRDAPCKTCRFLTDPSVPNPLAAARRTTNAPPPGQEAPKPPPPPPATTIPSTLVAPSVFALAASIPNPPRPYERLKTGGISITRKDKDGNESSSIIYPHDLYPLKRLVDKAATREQQVWRATLPRAGAKDFVIDADVLYDARKFCVAIANNGIYPNKADIPALQDYMVAYISQLQRQIDADNQLNHLGWTDEFRAFVLPDKTLWEDGRVTVSALTKHAETSTQFIHKRGDLQEQIKLMHFYDRPVYIPNQSVILDSFASIIFYATGNHGIVVNCSGDSGASKSTTLYAAASPWGDPTLWPINGTNRGATPNARAQRVFTNSNLPTTVDEITHMLPRDVADLAMSATQPGHRLRLSADGSEKETTGGYKSAIMITTANTSLHTVMSADNAAGTAGSMRVFEMKFVPQFVHTKGEADEFLRQVRMHYGHLGEIFAQFVVRNRVAIEHRVHALMLEIDREGRIASSERFWSARIACNLVTAEICKALGLLPYAVEPLRAWSIHQQIPYMRGIVHDEYRDPLAVLSDYIAEKNSNIVVIDRATSIGSNTNGAAVVGSNAFPVNHMSGALLGHYDLRSGVLYLLKQGFKEHCNRVGASATRIIEDLAQPRTDANGLPTKIVTEKAVRRTLGAGTALAKGQVWCIAVDMNHPEVSGAVNLRTVQGTGQAATAPAGSLSVVK